MKYNLQNNPILLPHQIEILKLFFATSFTKPFFLTGGTALSAFYLAHRDSKDLGLSEFYFANTIVDISQIKIWPDLKIDLDKQAMFAFYQKLTTDLLLKVKPENKWFFW